MISPSHLKTHGITGAEYKLRFPGSILRMQSDDTKAKIAQKKVGQVAWNANKKTGPNTKLSETLKGKSRPELRGKKRSDEQKNAISAATKLAMKGKMTDDVKARLRQSIAQRKQDNTYIAPMTGKSMSAETRQKIAKAMTGDNNWIRRRLNQKIDEMCIRENLTYLHREKSSRTGSALYFRCNKCEHEFSFGIGYFTPSQISRRHAVEENICPACYPRIKTKSQKELDLLEYIRTLIPDEVVKSGDRTSIFPYELDVYIPGRNIAIEFCGIYWHAENVSKKSGSVVKREFVKHQRCKDQGIRLITIFEDEWDKQNDIVRDRLAHILGRKSTVIGARKCVIREISYADKRSFLQEHHIQSADRAKINLGAYAPNGELIGVMTFSPTNFTKGGDGSQFELNRFALGRNIHSPGLASKMLKYFNTHFNTEKLDIISYSDNRWSNGNVYQQIGFSYLTESKPSYFYVNMNSSVKTRQHRSNFMKHRLQKIFNTTLDMTKSEWEIMQEMGYDRVWDCGTTKWILTNGHK